MGDVERPDTVNVLSTLENGATAVYLFSGAAHCAPNEQIEIYGTKGTLVYHTNVDLRKQKIYGAKSNAAKLAEIKIPKRHQREWTIEQDFIDAIRTGENAESTFYQGVKYMEFTEAVFRSVEQGATVRLPIVD
tara:strand:- start:423 stop:821 length:399 start_codon:yes stop_codon:yes gene_type:complete